MQVVNGWVLRNQKRNQLGSLLGTELSLLEMALFPAFPSRFHPRGCVCVGGSLFSAFLSHRTPTQLRLSGEGMVGRTGDCMGEVSPGGACWGPVAFWGPSQIRKRERSEVLAWGSLDSPIHCLGKAFLFSATVYPPVWCLHGLSSCLVPGGGYSAWKEFSRYRGKGEGDTQ